MPKTMPKPTREKNRWIKPILKKEKTIKQTSKIYPFSERSLKYWLADYRKQGMKGLENKSTRPKSHPNETPIRTKEKIIELRKKTLSMCLKDWIRSDIFSSQPWIALIGDDI